MEKEYFKNFNIRERIWGSRLQLGWILFATIYLYVGKETDEKLISSILISVGGLLICVVMAHVLLDDDHSVSESLLLISLTASIFLVYESENSFKDILGSIFAGIFSTLVIVLIWTDNGWRQH